MRVSIAILAVAIGSALGCGGGGEKQAADSPFAYDTTAPLEYVDRGVVKKEYPIAVHDVSYSTPAGSRIDAILAGIERRIVSFGPLSAGSTPVAEYAEQAPEELRMVIRDELGAVDPLRWIALAPPDSILLQDGRNDEIVPESALRALAEAAGPAATWRWYDQGHAPSDRAFADQLDWLANRLDLDGSIVERAAGGPG